MDGASIEGEGEGQSFSAPIYGRLGGFYFFFFLRALSFVLFWSLLSTA
jgi:hypothetical protein